MPKSTPEQLAYASAHGKRRARTDDVACLLHGAARRARERGVPYTLRRKDIKVPERCPVLDIPLARRGREFQVTGRKNGGPRPDAPSLDRIRPKEGYVPGNVRVISFRANSVRGTATADELRLALADAERLEGRCCPTATPHPPPIDGTRAIL